MANTLKMYLTIILQLLPMFALVTSDDPLVISYPSVMVHAKDTGDFTMLSGFNGDIVIHAGPNNTGGIYFEGDDLLEIFKMAASLPPVWQQHSPFGYLGEFSGGSRISEQLQALDPEGGTIAYTIVAGTLPPGVNLNAATGRIQGLAPDADLTYVFTVRATDNHVKFADSVFKIVVRGSDSCATKPCQHEGVCADRISGYHCGCVHPYGGFTCNTNCRGNSLGVSSRGTKTVPNAHMSAYKTYSTYLASNGRLYASNGWMGTGPNSWLQVDLGNVTNVHGIQVQGCSGSYYTSRYFIKYSLDGNTFTNYTTTSSQAYTMSGGTSTSVATANLPGVLSTRYVRFFPVSYANSLPCMKVELLGCYKYK